MSIFRIHHTRTSFQWASLAETLATVFVYAVILVGLLVLLDLMRTIPPMQVL
jgi:hypothetical protein